MWIPFTNWQPDLDPITPGELTTPSANFVPTRRGYRQSNGFGNITGQQTLTASAVGLFYAVRTDASAVLYAADSQHMYVRVGYSWTVCDGTTTVSAVSNRFQFAQWGDITFAGAKETQSMVSDTTTFTSIPTMPRFGMIDISNEFVMIGNVAVSVTYSDGYGNTLVTPGDYPDRWWCSGVGNGLAWQPNAATQAASGRLTELPGPLTAGRALADNFIFYKKRGVWVGTYEGNPFVWTWACVSREVGVHGPQCVIVVDNKHFFVGDDDFYVFDGQQVKSIGSGVRELFFNNVRRDYLYKTLGFVDRNEKIVYWGYVSGASQSGAIDKFVCFHYENGRWGNSGDFAANVWAEAYADNLTYDQLWTAYTFDTVPNTEFDRIGVNTQVLIPVFLTNADGRLVTMQNGPPQNSTLVTMYGGDDQRTSLFKRLRMRWITPPSYAELIPYRLMRQGEVPTPGITRTMTNARFDFTQVARWHKVQIKTVGAWETTGVDIDILPRGRE